VRNLVLIGAGGHAKACLDIIEDFSDFNILGFVDNKKQENCSSYKVLGDDAFLSELRADCDYAFITVGQIKSSEIRRRLYQELKTLKFSIPSFVSKASIFSNNASIGDGSIAMHGSIINSEASIGINCILNSKSLIEHEVSLGDFCHISTGAIVNGGCTIGNDTFIGSGSIIKEGIKIGDNCIIGANTFVNSDLENNTKFIGSK
jgi:sugar O-acyltransferase (sialic acid O-acetyltransferase NeuD family)